MACLDHLPPWSNGDILTICVTFLSDAQPLEEEAPSAERGGQRRLSVLTDFSVLINGKDVGISSHSTIEVRDLPYLTN